MKKKGYHSTQKKYFNTIPKSEFYGVAIGYALGLILTGALRMESQIPQLALAVVGFLIGYYVDYKYYRVKDEPDAPAHSAIEETDEPVDAAIEETDKPGAAAAEETDKPGAAAAEETDEPGYAEVEETYVYGSASTGGADDPEDQESGQ